MNLLFIDTLTSFVVLMVLFFAVMTALAASGKLESTLKRFATKQVKRAVFVRRRYAKNNTIQRRGALRNVDISTLKNA